MNTTKHAVASTGLLVAAMRAAETRREDALFTDPFADELAGPEGQRLLGDYLTATGSAAPDIIEIRTRFWDDALMRAQATPATQFVIVAAGRDARAHRLSWRPGTTVYEVDQTNVIAAKEHVLAGRATSCRRVPIGVDLADDWPTHLLAEGFSADSRTVWLIEGLLQYLDAEAVNLLFERIDALSSSGSTVCYDVVGRLLLGASYLSPVLTYMADLGAPWTFGTDRPAELVERLGWSASVTDVAEVGNRWGRWPGPAVPLEVPDVARGYFVEGIKG
ncbi:MULTISPECIES: SAM-dependent methyltransferase [unclassified Mycobacterium]|uniref:SAM-dependent methyltransferase n=1 Tax=unclassified Mycobacterium TaxID=2642494 RepID=UPI0029C87BBF|nr:MULTISPECIES: SAM-dependent methyltransferase [unclassified Mycobacterium]